MTEAADIKTKMNKIRQLLQRLEAEVKKAHAVLRGET
jgi:hypothetical protein